MEIARVSSGSQQSGGPLTNRQYLVPFCLIVSLFFLWAIGVNLNDVLIPHLKRAFRLTDFESSFVQLAFFGGYFLAAWPAGRLMEKIGYQRGIVCGLLICAAGAFLFIPAATVHLYWIFLTGLFIMACGQSFLEVSANPYVTFLGPAQSSEQRLVVAQSFNAVGAVVTPFIGSIFILSRVRAQGESADVVRGPYMVIVAVFVAMALLILKAKLPVISEEKTEEGKLEGDAASFPGVRAFPHLLKGVMAQFFYIGAQVGVASFVIRFVEHTYPGTSDAHAANYLKAHLIAFMIGRFGGAALMKRIQPPSMLMSFAIGCLGSGALVLFAHGEIALIGIVLLGFFHSIMFPTIFALSIRHLGPFTKRGASLLVMSIIGGAIFPPLMGLISDATNIRMAFLVPMVCYAVVLYFAMSGYKVKEVAAAQS
ncbi:sugar MFS transporter [Silvibacterium acidisoli]|uniref:sugar MFS transporter n=1 Tax=Acidobacteriaceae bacterium ZG23-2 TaxID=2883246 RepID=UPI00406C526A